MTDTCVLATRLTDAGYPADYQHRKAWEAKFGPRPAGAHIHHICRTKACINPDHLVPLDHRDHLRLHHLEEKGLTLADIQEIRQLGTAPVGTVRAVDLAAKYGVCRDTIHNIWRGAYWTFELGYEGTVKPSPGECERTGCTQPVTGRRHKRYCSSRCREMSNRWKRGVADALSRKESGA